MSSLSAGDRLGPYEIIASIGAGGMGEVYRARDPRLNRDVAIKVAAARFNERSAREARAVASLNHPNICHLYDVGQDYLVMELVEGPTLAERIQRGPLSLEEHSRSPGRSRKLSTRRMKKESSIAISSRRTSKSGPMGWLRSWISAWPK